MIDYEVMQIYPYQICRGSPQINCMNKDLWTGTIPRLRACKTRCLQNAWLLLRFEVLALQSPSA